MGHLCEAYGFLGYICKLVVEVASAEHSPIWTGLGIISAVVTGFVFVLKPLMTFFKNRRTSKKLLRLEEQALIPSYQDIDFADASKDYITPYCSNIDPSNQDDLRNVVGVKESIFSALDNELNSNAGKRHILLLADSGMGKTTFLLNFLLREQSKKRGGKRVALVPLNRGDAVEQIKAIKNPKDTLLLLDAFDEDTAAIQDYVERMNVLITASGNFKAVIMTCRTQFFSQESAIPKVTGLLKVGITRAGSPSFHEWRTLYVLPFDTKQITAYIKIAIPFTSFRRRSRAKEILKQIPELAVRPMLLSLIPQLVVTKSDAHNLWELYEFMVEQWALREKSWVDPESLKSLSKKLAWGR